MMDLNVAWFLLITVLLAGYAVLDGFDLGVGVLHLFARNEHERRLHLNAIGPVWDGNEVWLLTGGGAMFAAFPPVYATAFSGLYLALVLLLLALIFRAVAIEFRGKVESPAWRRAWDWGFGLGSLLPAALLGVAFGNVMRGLPMDGNHVFTGSFLGLLNPYSLLVGVLSLVLFVAHGALYMTVKTDGELRERMGRVASGGWVAVVVLFLAVMVATFFAAPHLFDAGLKRPLFWVVLILLLSGLVYQPVALKAGRFLAAFLASSLSVVCMVGLAAVCLFPRLVPSITDLNYSLDIYNAASTPRTLTVMLIIALIGMPMVLIYTAFIYWAFRGKTVIHEESY
ncbi:MAG TPA: cytochrome d ubiquinol oxidase subunit II [Phycisphaerae bacterium]|nr:cytochrome d ubiquinol oxidase subunit II [Phycisphaerae bacterium]